MKKLHNEQSGFGTIELVIIIVVVALLGTVGWEIYKHQKKTTPSSTTPTTTNHSTTTTPSPTPDPTANWKKVSSIGGAYSIKIPDGWAVTNYPGNVMNSDSVTFSSGKPAVITPATTAYAGDQKRFNIGIGDSASTLSPQWQTPNPYGTESTEDFSIGSLSGKRFSIEYTQTVTGITKGEKIYDYGFDVPNGKQLGIVYIQYPGDADNLATVEQAIKTIIVN